MEENNVLLINLNPSKSRKLSSSSSSFSLTSFSSLSSTNAFLKKRKRKKVRFKKSLKKKKRSMMVNDEGEDDEENQIKMTKFIENPNRKSIFIMVSSSIVVILMVFIFSFVFQLNSTFIRLSKQFKDVSSDYSRFPEKFDSMNAKIKFLENNLIQLNHSIQLINQDHSNINRTLIQIMDSISMALPLKGLPNQVDTLKLNLATFGAQIKEIQTKLNITTKQ